MKYVLERTFQNHMFLLFFF